MITSNMIYWLTRLDSICAAMAILFGIFIIATIGWACGFTFEICESYENDKEDVKNLFIKKLGFIPLTAVVLLIIGTFVPTTKEACAMYVIPKIVNNESTQVLSKEAIDLAHAWVEELKPKHEEEKNSSESKK